MANAVTKLWPYRNAAAFLVMPLIWLLLAIVLYLSSQTLNWPGQESRDLITKVILAAGCIPLLLVAADFLAAQRAVLSYKDFKLDFSQIDLSQAEIKREVFGLPDNIGVSGPIVSDTAPMNIIETLREAVRHEFVVADLGDGNAWWVTRLLALVAGATRAGNPSTIVFVGRLENQDRRFLGWATARDVLSAILQANPAYAERFRRAERIARQVTMYGQNEFLPNLGGPLIGLPLEIQRYTGDARYAMLGDEVTEQIIMDQLGGFSAGASLEQPPDRLTLARLNDLFGHCLYRSAIELTSPPEQQIETLLELSEPCIALVRHHRFEGIMKREEGERLIVKQLYAQSQAAAKPRS